eukprot:947164-Pleurochrysis_carterae.AAC.2
MRVARKLDDHRDRIRLRIRLGTKTRLRLRLGSGLGSNFHSNLGAEGLQLRIVLRLALVLKS